MTDAASSPERPRPAAWPYWLPVAAWVAVMLNFSSLPDPKTVLGSQVMGLGDAVLHSGGFVVLMLLASRWAIFRAGGFGLRPVAWAWLGCAGYAVFDEVHQLLLPGRSFQWLDLTADLAGALAAALLVLLLGSLLRSRR